MPPAALSRHANSMIFIPSPIVFIPSDVMISYAALNPAPCPFESDWKFINTSGPGRRYTAVLRRTGPLIPSSLHSVYKISDFKDPLRI